MTKKWPFLAHFWPFLGHFWPFFDPFLAPFDGPGPLWNHTYLICRDILSTQKSTKKYQKIPKKTRFLPKMTKKSHFLTIFGQKWPIFGPFLAPSEQTRSTMESYIPVFTLIIGRTEKTRKNTKKTRFSQKVPFFAKMTKKWHFLITF